MHVCRYVSMHHSSANDELILQDHKPLGLWNSERSSQSIALYPGEYLPISN